MSNSFVNTHAPEGAQAGFAPEGQLERHTRLEGTWLNIFDVTVPAGGRTPLHRHESPEILRIIEGCLIIRRMTDQGLEEFEATAGDIVRIEADQAHGYSNRGPDVARFSATIDSDMSDFFEAAESRTRDLLTVVANSDSTRILAA